ncbi:hypothetical protein Moror_12229 [Moniliophthora roreri MCA 2997]|uniref:Uncharacterized protein n=2 Tax=Moniliophthora roreri TaxID=221103 RepID=V2XTW7_MONRO|nr:hypothetical protein Moror_12229 [Moniliophthora roreri MCA 2997]
MNKWTDWHELRWPTPHDFESLKLQLFTESFTSRKYTHPGDNPYVTVTSAPADPNTPSYPGVRTDFLFGFLPFFKSVNDMAAQETPKIVDTLNNYAEGRSRMSSRGGKATAQKRAELAKINWDSAKHRIYMADSQRQIMTYSEDERNIVKTIVAVELKHFNHLAELEDFAQKGITFYGPDDLVSTGPDATSPHLRGLQSIMQQVVRYGLWYGSRYIYLTDYENHVVIELDDLVKELEKKKEDRDRVKITNLKWYKVNKEDGRWLLAWTIYRAGKDIRDDFRKHYLEDLKWAGL